MKRRHNVAADEWEVIGHIGDVNAIEYGGGPVLRNLEDGHILIEYTYGMEGEEDSPMDGDEGYEDFVLTVYRVEVEDDVFDYHDWCDVDSVASTIGADPEELEEAGRSPNVMDRVWATEAIASNWGWEELDHYPVTFTVAELEEQPGWE